MRTRTRSWGFSPAFLSAKALAELVGVAPSYLDADDAMDVTWTPQYPADGDPTTTYAEINFSQAQMLDPGTSFSTLTDGFEQIEMGGGYDDYVTGGPMPVNFDLSGSVLGVPQPTAYPVDPVVAQTMQFSESGPISSDAFTPGSPADTNGLTYSWDFGDGTPATTPSPSPSVSHSFAAAGPYGVRVTVIDAAGNAGVSPQPTFVSVGAPAPAPPVCSAQSVNVTSASATPLTLDRADAAGDPADALTFSVGTNPSHGALSGLDPAHDA